MKLLIAILILSTVLIAGCTQTISNTVPKEYSIKITSAEILPDCLWNSMYGGIHNNCTDIVIEISSESDSSFDVILNKFAIVLKDGNQINMRRSGLDNDRCYGNQLYYLRGGFTVFPNAKKNIDLCFDVLKKEDSPKLYVGLLYNYKMDAYGQITGDQREYSFDLAPYLT